MPDKDSFYWLIKGMSWIVIGPFWLAFVILGGYTCPKTGNALTASTKANLTDKVTVADAVPRP